MQEDNSSQLSDHYEKHADNIRDLSNDPKKILEMGSNSKLLNNSFPQMGASITAHMTNAVNFLNSKLPKPNNELPLSPQWQPSSSQKQKFNRYFETLNDPVNVLTHVKNGTLSNEHMEALQAVYPELLQEMQQKVMSHMDPDKAKDVSHSTKLALSKFMGTPLSTSAMPNVVMANQAAFAMPTQQQQPMTKRGQKSTQIGLAKLNVSQLAATRTQNLEKDNV